MPLQINTIAAILLAVLQAPLGTITKNCVGRMDFISQNEESFVFLVKGEEVSKRMLFRANPGLFIITHVLKRSVINSASRPWRC